MVVFQERGRDGGMKIPKECTADDMRQLSLRQDDAQDCTISRNGILSNHPNRASAKIQLLNQ
jgi:hypothetical protein